MNTNSLDLLLVNAPSKVQVYQDLASLSAIEPPVWAGLIARYCLNHGFSVQILDAEADGLSIEQTAERIRLLSPLLTVFCIYGHQPSASTQCLPAASAVARHIKRITPTLALGTHPSALPAKTILEEPFDYVCQGEGPKTIEGLLSELEHGKPANYGFGWGPAVDHIPGLTLRTSLGRPDGKAIALTSRTAATIENLDAELPSQTWELLDMKKYRAHNWHLWTGDPEGGYASVQTSLGCTFHCQFCCIQAPFGNATPRMRFWSPDNVIEQFKTLQDFGITNIKIPDEMFCLNRNHVKEICKGIINSVSDHLNIWAYARVDTVKDEEMLDLLRRAGFRWLGIGIESASKHVRDGVEKGRSDNEQIIESVRRVQRHGIAVAANYIFGLPDDTQESMQQTLDLACEINAEMANFYCAMAYPGSPLHGIAKQKGWKLPEDDPTIGWLGYSQQSYETLPLPTETLTAQQVLDFRDEAFLRYFSRPEYQAMLLNRFGARAENEVNRMLLKGKPRRRHREQQTV